MKSWLLVTLSTLFGGEVCAQQEPEKPRDGTHSVHNYKHPNKAKASLNEALKNGVVVRTPAVSRDVQANHYKLQTPTPKPRAGVVLEHTPTPDYLRDYKKQGVK